MKRFSAFVSNEDKQTYSGSWDAFCTFTGLWSRPDIFFKPSIKALFLDEKKTILGHASLDTVHFEHEHIKQITKIMEKENASSIILGQNCLHSRICPTEQETEEATNTHWIISSNKIMLQDHLVLAEDAYFSYTENKLLKKLILVA